MRGGEHTDDLSLYMATERQEHQEGQHHVGRRSVFLRQPATVVGPQVLAPAARGAALFAADVMLSLLSLLALTAPPDLERVSSLGVAEAFRPWNHRDLWDGASEKNYQATLGVQTKQPQLGGAWVNVKRGGREYRHFVRGFGDGVSSVIMSNGVWPDCMRLLDLWRRLDMIASEAFVDVGANVGACTLLMGATFDNMTLAAFEPNEANLFYLTRSLAANSRINARTTLYPYGLGAKPSIFPLYVQARNAGNSVLGSRVHTAASPLGKVRVVPLDALSERLGTVRLMKMDVRRQRRHTLTATCALQTIHVPWGDQIS